jgi:hypothetical protein
MLLLWMLLLLSMLLLFCDELLLRFSAAALQLRLLFAAFSPAASAARSFLFLFSAVAWPMLLTPSRGPAAVSALPLFFSGGGCRSRCTFCYDY